MKGWESVATLPHMVPVKRQARPPTHCGCWGGQNTITKEHNCKAFIICLLSSILILLRPSCNQPEWKIVFSALTMPFAAANPCPSAAEQTAKRHISHFRAFPTCKLMDYLSKSANFCVMYESVEMLSHCASVFVRCKSALCPLMYSTEKTHHIVISQVFTFAETRVVTQYFLPCFCVRLT